MADAAIREMHRQWVKAQDVAAMLGVSVHTVRSWRQRGQGPPAYAMVKSIRYDRSEVERWRAGKRLRGDGTIVHDD